MDKVVLVFNYNNEAYVFIMYAGDSLDKILDAVCFHWAVLRKDNVFLYYDLPDIPRCCIRTDLDLSNMFDVAMMERISRIHLHLQVNIIDIPSSSNSNTLMMVEMSEDELSDIGEDTNCMDVLSSFDPPSNEKVLMTVGWDNMIHTVGQHFEGGGVEFKMCIRKMSLECGFRIRCVKNDIKRVTVVCADKELSGCKWLVHGTLEAANGFFYLRRFMNVHTCDFLSRDFKGQRMTSDLVAELVGDHVRVDTSIGPTQVQNLMKLNYGLEVSYAVCGHGLKKAKAKAFGDLEESFKSLRWYVDKLIETNPGSYVDLQVDPSTNKFQRIFIAYSASINGFKHCRPLICMDGAHLKAATQGHILAATGKNANREIYPLCFAVVQSENGDNWSWFLDHLKAILDPSRIYTFITDRNQGLLDKLPIVFPDCFHSYCYHHLSMNLRDRCSNRACSAVLRDRLGHLFMKCAYAPTVSKFKYWMNQFLREGGNISHAFLSNLPPEKWANAYFPGMRYGDLCSNVAESFNNWIKKERSLMVTNMVDKIRLKMMKMMTKRRDASEKWESAVCPSSVNLIGDYIQKVRTWDVLKSSNDVYEVQCGYTVAVNIRTRSCSCGNWQITRFPCKHAVASILHTGNSIFSYIDPVFSKSEYQQTYSDSIFPIPIIEKPDFSEDDSSNDVLPPDFKRAPGRPRLTRKRCRGEFIRPITCSSCHAVGNHNMRSCPGRIES